MASTKKIDVGVKTPANVVRPGSESSIDHTCLPGQDSNRNDEEQPLLGDDPGRTTHTLSNFQVASIIAVILLGEFLGSMDGTLVTAAGPVISSKFGRPP